MNSYRITLQVAGDTYVLGQALTEYQAKTQAVLILGGNPQDKLPHAFMPFIDEMLMHVTRANVEHFVMGRSVDFQRDDAYWNCQLKFERLTGTHFLLEYKLPETNPDEFPTGFSSYTLAQGVDLLAVFKEAANYLELVIERNPFDLNGEEDTPHELLDSIQVLEQTLMNLAKRDQISEAVKDIEVPSYKKDGSLLLKLVLKVVD